MQLGGREQTASYTYRVQMPHFFADYNYCGTFRYGDENLIRGKIIQGKIIQGKMPIVAENNYNEWEQSVISTMIGEQSRSS